VRSLLRAILPVLTALAVVSCATTLIKQDNLQTVKRGMTRPEFQRHVTAKPREALLIDYEGATYPVDIYDMQTGTKTVTTMQYVWTKYGGYSYPVTTIVPVTVAYLFIFDESGLVYWGFENELNREEDDLLQALSPLIVKAYVEKKALDDEKRKKQQEQTRR
jgi:hypothetical protein